MADRAALAATRVAFARQRERDARARFDAAHMTRTPTPEITGQLAASTAPGRRLVETIERLAVEFEAGAAHHDVDGTYAHEHIEALQRSGYLVAPIPERLGGLGVSSTHDVLVAAARLARGDPATAIGVNMHLSVVLNLVRQWDVAMTLGRSRQAAAVGETLETIAYRGVIIAAAASEPAQDLTRPATTAVRHGDGWVINGRKIFCTLAPAAHVLNVAVSAFEGEAPPRYAFASVPASTAGVEVHDDWDALGMRASGSHSVTFHDVVVPAGAVGHGFVLGEVSGALLERYLVTGAFHAAASLGIAEAAHHHAVTALRARPLDGPTAAHQSVRLAENVIDLRAMQALFDRAARGIDEHWDGFPAGDPTLEASEAAMVEVQAAKAFLGDAAVRVVDRAMALSGGAGYLTRSPLSRAYRDARAAAFMHPFGANRALDLIARGTLGLEALAG